MTLQDDIKEIGWALYKKEYHDKVELYPDSTANGGVRELHLIQSVEGTLRKSGKHVLPDHENLGMWIFSLSEVEKEDVTRTLENFGFSCSRAGIIQAEALSEAMWKNGMIKSPGNISGHRQGPEDSNAHAFSEDFRSKLQGKSQGEPDFRDYTSGGPQVVEISQLIGKIILALYLSLSHLLAAHEGFLQVGLHSFIETRTLGDAILEDLSLNWGSAKTFAISLEINWLPTGTLLISYSRISLPKLYRLPHRFQYVERKLSGESPLLLSPSGMVAKFCGVDHTSSTDHMNRSRENIKSVVSSALLNNGISLPEDSQWVRVLVDHQTDENTELGADPQQYSFVTLWPAHLCLREETVAGGGYEEVDRSKGSGHRGIDALAAAEAWYLGKHARLKALEDQRQKYNIETPHLNVSDGSGDEDALSDPGLQLTQFTASQDASGIYPTPPDGVPTNAIDLSPGNNLRTFDPENGENIISSPIAMSQRFDETGNEDLFGNMDIDMFATNGLTEADFSFFDEPNDTGLQGDPQSSVGNDFEGQQGTAIPAQGAGLLEDSPTFSMPESQNHHAKQSTLLNEGVLFKDLDSETSLQDANLSHLTDTQDACLEAKCHIGQEEKLPNDPEFDTEALDDVDSAQRSSFDPVNFKRTTSVSDGKYAIPGRYGFGGIDPPTTAKPGDHVYSHEGLVPHPGVSPTAESTSEDEPDIDHTDDELSVESPMTTNENGEIFADFYEVGQRQMSRKRKRGQFEEPNSKDTPASPSSAVGKPVALLERTLTWPPPAFIFPMDASQGMIPQVIGSKSASPHVPVFTNNNAFMEVAQMVVDQAVSEFNGSQDLYGNAPQRDAASRQETYYVIEKAMATLSSKAGKVSKRCTVKDYAGLGEKVATSGTWEQTSTSQGLKTLRLPHPSRPPSLGVAQSLVKLELPYTCVRRIGTTIDISASSLRFWEELSLAPAHDSKNVNAFCMFPDNDHASARVAIFLGMIKGAYQNCNLGSHDLGSILPRYIDGRVPFSRKDSVDLAADLGAECEFLGARLGKLGLQGGNTVIYMVDCCDLECSLPVLCAAFLKLFKAYNIALREAQIDQPNDLVLQILPSHLVFSADSIPMPSPTEYRRLAFEVYNRCGPNQGALQWHEPQYLSAPAVRLAKSIPKAIDLRLNPESSVPRLQSDNCIHLAYVWTPGDRWLTASWTDSYGVLAWNACYYFRGEDETQWESLAEVVKEIWETTLEMMHPPNSPWRLYICKDHVVDGRELDAWQRLFVDSSKPQVSIAFLIIDTNPLLDLPLRDDTNRLAEFPSGLFATPGNTPQSNAASPDISGFGTTPGGAPQVNTPPPNTGFADYDTEARLVDVTSETWVMITNDANQYPTLSEHGFRSTCSVLASAYLMKRAGPRDEDGVVRIAFNVIYGQTNHSTMLKEALNIYAGLASLARVRAMRDAGAARLVESVLPCHVIAARRAHVAVSATMRYGNG